MSEGDYHVVRHANGTCSVGCRRTGEVMHPVIGPVAEARRLYVEGLDLLVRASEAEQFCIWDIGMGAGANVLVAIDALSGRAKHLDVVSFDHTAEALRFAVERPKDFDYVAGFAAEIETLLTSTYVEFNCQGTNVHWRFLNGGFLDELSLNGDNLPCPDAILFDAWSPLKNSGMWTLEVFRAIHSQLKKPCSLATYSRATCVRTALLLAGFFVGKGGAVGAKEESTVAANDPILLQNPLEASWLEKASRSHSGHPLKSDSFTQEPLTEVLLNQLRNHPQFL